MRITACYIVKNEEQNILRSVKSLEGMYDELIIVDTGSTDRTMEVAKSMGGKCFSFHWQDDFASARNYALSKVNSDWVIFLDADQYYLGGTSIRNYLFDIEKNHPYIDALFVRVHNDEKFIIPASREPRIFRNNDNIMYKGVIHEHLIKLNGTLELMCADCLEFFHTGYKKDIIASKLIRNLNIIEKDIIKNGEKEEYYYYIAECYFGLKNYLKAIEYIMKAFDSNVVHVGDEANYYHILIESMRQCEFPLAEMEHVCWKAISLFPAMPEFYAEQGMVLSSMGRLIDSLIVLDKCIEYYKAENRNEQAYGYLDDDNIFLVYKRGAEVLSLLTEKNFKLSVFVANKMMQNETIFETMKELKEIPFYLSIEYKGNKDIVYTVTEKLITYCVDLLLKNGLKLEECVADVDELNKYFYAALIYDMDGNYQESLRQLMILENYSVDVFDLYPHLYYYKALALYNNKEYLLAKTVFEKYCCINPSNEVAHFFLGNTLTSLGDFESALREYSLAYDKSNIFIEALSNSAYIAKKMGDVSLEELLLKKNILSEFVEGIIKSPYEITLKINDNINYYELPIFINSYNRLGTLKKLLAWLINSGYKKIYILDNASSYKPLLDYYKQIEGKVKVIYLKENMGYKALWNSGILNTLHIKTPYVYTDSDVVPIEECPQNILEILTTILRKYPFLKKVGLGLKIDDITYYDAEKTKEKQKRFYKIKMDEDLYFGAVDTTFALYRNYRHYNIYVSARTTGKLMMRHMPWYYDYDNLPKDEQYYLATANSSSTIANDIKNMKLY